MNVSEQIINVLDNLCQKFGIAIDWTAENILPYLKELCGKIINYEIYTSVALIILTLIACIIFWGGFAATFKSAKSRHWCCDYFIADINITFAVIAIIMSVIFFIVACVQTFDIIEAIHIPEKSIYDFIIYHMPTK